MSIHQRATAGRDSTQVGGNMVSSRSIHINFFVILIGVLAMGGLAWTMYIASKSQNPSNTAPTEVLQSPKPAP